MLTYEWVDPKRVIQRDVMAMNKLLAQLTESPTLLTLERVKEVATQSFWLVAVDTSKGHRVIKGMNTMTISHIPTGIVGHLDDVIVDESLRGQGVGEELLKRLLKQAKEEEVDRVELTCNPIRVAANKLYQKLGFKQRETNCYMLKL
jgi:ribosomal protein S18 acetylase RimI-like enzyme